jgi:hypothetical protein
VVLAGPGALVVGPVTAARRRPTQPAQTGLWGRSEPLAKPAPARREVNDLDLIESVIRTATDPGYVLIGPAERVYLRERGSTRAVTRVPGYEADAVAQLLDSRHLSVGGTHIVRANGREGPARSVLVSKSARSMLARWQALRPLR